jgi:hypothetical protein
MSVFIKYLYEPQLNFMAIQIMINSMPIYEQKPSTNLKPVSIDLRALFIPNIVFLELFL